MSVSDEATISERWCEGHRNDLIGVLALICVECGLFDVRSIPRYAGWDGPALRRNRAVMLLDKLLERSDPQPRRSIHSQPPASEVLILYETGKERICKHRSIVYPEIIINGHWVRMPATRYPTRTWLVRAVESLTSRLDARRRGEAIGAPSDA